MNSLPSPTGFEILLEDGPVLAIHKPAGLLTQAPVGVDSLEFRLKQYLRRRDNKTGDIYLGVPHRIDRPVSGVILFARHVRAARRLSEQFEARTIQKKYWALVGNAIAPDSGEWTDYLTKLDGEPRSIVSNSQDPAAKLAVLTYRVLQQLPAAALLEIELQTGRNHQIRVQCASRGAPLLGDELYGSTLPFGPPSADPRERLIGLHARSIAFRHPMTGADMQVVAPLPGYWIAQGVREEENSAGDPMAILKEPLDVLSRRIDEELL